MSIVLWIGAAIGSASLLAWVWLLVGRGWFWMTDQRLRMPLESSIGTVRWPSVAVVVPARNEVDILPHSLPTLLKQDYPGPLHIFLVDDGSEDGTAEVAREVATQTGLDDRLTVVCGEPLPQGWAGKVWALHQGIDAAHQASRDYYLFTDADIAYSPGVLQAIVVKAQSDRLDLVSLMAQLRVSTFWERMLIPAFVFFFAKIYPFRWVNDAGNRTAAAAGGCVLLRRGALEQAGGFRQIADAIIDDCALAKLVKGKNGGGRIWLGLTHEVRSLRAYHGLRGIWAMVARTAFAQLNYSPLNLLGTVLGMLVVYLAPVLALVTGLIALGTSGDRTLSVWMASVGFAAWTVMFSIYLPMVKWYRVSPLLPTLLPVTAMLYTSMTIDSALRTWKGRGGAWKGRTYGPSATLEKFRG